MNKHLGLNCRYHVVESLIASFPKPSSSEDEDNNVGQSLATVLSTQLSQLEPKQHPLVKNICYGVFRHFYFLNALINKELNKAIRKKDRDISFVLLAGCYELIFLNTPAHAVISESVNLCSLRKKIWAKSLVNAVLRNIQRNYLSNEPVSPADIKLALIDSQQEHEHSEELLFEHPQWFINRVRKDWPEHVQSIFEQNTLRAPMTLRINQQKSSGANYLKLLKSNGLAAKLSADTQQCLYLDQAIDVTQLPHFSEGWLSVQDESAQQAAALLDIEKNMSVLDACSAPGGKAGHILETEPSTNLLCVDKQAKRLIRVQENLARLNVSAHLIEGDASKPDQWWDGQYFDRILLDAPCSASGIIRRNPDIKHQRNPHDPSRLADIQLSLLNALWKCLAPKGLLLYATCSIFKEENEALVEQFLMEEEGAQLKVLDLSFGERRPFGHQVFPTENGPDGFFYALLRKQN